jgi:flagellar hook-associated protein 3 FlgL
MTVVPLSSSLFYDRSAAGMTALSTQADTISEQISTGQKMSAPSDDPVTYQRLQGLAAQTADSTANASNVATAQSLLTQADTALSSITTQLQSANSLIVQAKSGTQTAAGLAAIGTELTGIAGSIAGLVAGTNSNGQPLFGGSDGGAAITTNADGTHTLASTPAATIPIGGGQSVQAGATAAQVLSLPGGGNILDLLQSLGATLASGGTPSDDQETAVQGAAQQVTDVQSSLGATAARLTLVQTQITSANTDRAATQSSLADTDVTSAITQLQKTMTALQAAQASFSKLSSLSLFDYLK